MNVRGAIFLIFTLFAAARDAEAQDAYLWRQAMGGTVIGQPGVYLDSVIVALDSGSLKAYSAAGKFAWEYSSNGKLCKWFTLSREGASYICKTNGQFIAVNNAGRELWKTGLDAVLSGPVVTGWDGRVFVPAGKKICCFTAAGTPLWTLELDAAVSAGPWPDSAGNILLALEN